MHNDTRLLRIAFGICHAEGFMADIRSGYPYSRQAVQDRYVRRPQGLLCSWLAVRTKDLGNVRHHRREERPGFPNNKGTLCAFSVARAAGYFEKFRDLFPTELTSDKADDKNRFDVYIIKACQKFWKGGKAGKPSRPRLLFPRKSPIQEWAQKYDGKTSPKWLTKPMLNHHRPVIKSADDLVKPKALSLLFAHIPDQKAPEPAQARKDYQDGARDLIEKAHPIKPNSDMQAQQMSNIIAAKNRILALSADSSLLEKESRQILLKVIADREAAVTERFFRFVKRCNFVLGFRIHPNGYFNSPCKQFNKICICI